MTDTSPARNVTVRGTAIRTAPADHADLSFSVHRQATTSAQAVAMASEAYELLDGAITAAGNVVVRRTTVSLSVYPVTRWDPETGREHREGFRASRTETIRVAPPADANDALRRLMLAVPDVVVAGPIFGLDETNPVRQEVRSDAAADALRSAEAYARGLGLRTGDVRWIAEPGLDRGQGGGSNSPGAPEAHPMMMAKAAMDPSGAAGDAAGGGAILVDLSNQDVEVRAAVDLQVALEG